MQSLAPHLRRVQLPDGPTTAAQRRPTWLQLASRGLSHDDERAVAEAAALMGCYLQTAKTNLRRAAQQLKGDRMNGSLKAAHDECKVELRRVRVGRMVSYGRELPLRPDPPLTEAERAELPLSAAYSHVSGQLEKQLERLEDGRRPFAAVCAEAGLTPGEPAFMPKKAGPMPGPVSA